jgi:hypothetical protein
LEIRYRDQALPREEIAAVARTPAPKPKVVEAKSAKRKPPIPGADHPWRRDYRKMRPWAELRRLRCSPCLGLPLRLTEERAWALRSKPLAKINSAELDEVKVNPSIRNSRDVHSAS